MSWSSRQALKTLSAPFCKSCFSRLFSRPTESPAASVRFAMSVRGPRCRGAERIRGAGVSAKRLILPGQLLVGLRYVRRRAGDDLGVERMEARAVERRIGRLTDLVRLLDESRIA